MNYVYAILIATGLLLGAYAKGYTDADAKAAAEAKSVRDQDVAIALKMEPYLVHTITLNDTKTVTLTKEVTKYVDRYIPSPGAASVARPAYYLTWGAVGLWNSALGSPTPGGTAQAPAGALALSPVSFDDAETNAIQNFGQYADCRTIVKGWQDWYNAVRKVRP